MTPTQFISRRTALAGLTSTAASLLVPNYTYANQSPILTRKIPKTGENMPVVGMGTWITFNIGNDPQALKVRTEILRTFFYMGGRLIDSSPMYGSSEKTLGHALEHLKHPSSNFSATKVWTPLAAYGKYQIKNSHNLWKTERFDLLQVHNLVAWQSHLETLLQMKEEGKLRYVGVSTSHGLRHGQLEKIMTTQPLDFIQLTCNILDTKAEERILPIARERKIGVIINRPFRGGDLFERFANKKLPEWAKEINASNWAQFFLKYVISHPAVTCAIPATSQIAHMKENMGALQGPLPTQELRIKMRNYIKGL